MSNLTLEERLTTVERKVAWLLGIQIEPPITLDEVAGWKKREMEVPRNPSDDINLEITVRSWITEILQQHISLVGIAIQQRAKFEGWLKFELASYAQQKGCTNVSVEAPSEEAILNLRHDVTFYSNGLRCDIELKTPNTNWRQAGVINLTRPITQNMAEIVNDAKKLQSCKGQGLIAFVLFPIPTNDTRWEQYLTRIASELSLPLSVNEHTTRLVIPLGSGHFTDIIVCCFSIPRIDKVT